MVSHLGANSIWSPDVKGDSLPPQRCLAGLRIVEGRVELDVADRAIPDVILHANQAISDGRRQEAADLLARLTVGDLDAFAETPIRTDLLFFLGKLRFEIGQLEQARECLQLILAVEPHPIVHYLLAEAYLHDWRCVTQALEHAQQAVSHCPENALLLDQLGHCLCRAGRAREAVTVSEQAVTLDPDNPQWLERFLWRSNYVSQTTRRTLLKGFQRYSRLHSPVAWPHVTHANSPDTGRCLRVGFMSPDFRRHSVARAFEPLLDGMDRTTLQLYGYANVAEADAVTARFAAKFDVFRDIYGLSHEKMADRIRADGVDILVALAGHCQDNCLGVLAYRPAPVQVDYGGITTSGIAQIDFRLTDTLIDPPESLAYYTERSLYLPGGLASFVPPKSSPPVAEQPARRNGYVTFGSFNNTPKISGEALRLWARVLQAIPHSRLILKFPAGDDVGVREHYYRRFERLGVPRERLGIRGPLPYWDYLCFLSDVDIALDAYPYNGCITSMEALWMGVPILTLTGDTYVSRVGLSILSRLGLEMFSASDGREYVDKAVGFAAQVPALQQVRGGLRGMMLQSPLCDPARVAGEVESALRTMWRDWCDRQRVQAALCAGAC